MDAVGDARARKADQGLELSASPRCAGGSVPMRLRHATTLLLLAACGAPRHDSGSTQQQDAQVAARPQAPVLASGHPRRSERFADVELVTHDERKVRFRTDLVRDKAVLVNFMYTSCTGI